MASTNCETCKEQLGTEQVVHLCECNSAHHFRCVKGALESKNCPMHYKCICCSKSIKVPKVYYSHKVNAESIATLTDATPELLVTYKELCYPFHYRVGHWTNRSKDAQPTHKDAAKAAVKQIEDCDFVLSTLSSDAPETLTEVGIASAHNKPVFLAAPVTDGPRLPFAVEIATKSRDLLSSDYFAKDWLRVKNYLPEEMRSIHTEAAAKQLKRKL